MTLFGSAPEASSGVRAAAANARSAPQSTAPVPTPEPMPDAGPETLPAFERRARLRAKRHRLVGELARLRHASQREINTWVNHELDIESVQKATLEQLADSIELLENGLYGKQ
jgi:hypothetical protein